MSTQNHPDSTDHSHTINILRAVRPKFEQKDCVVDTEIRVSDDGERGLFLYVTLEEDTVSTMFIRDVITETPVETYGTTLDEGRFVVALTPIEEVAKLDH